MKRLRGSKRIVLVGGGVLVAAIVVILGAWVWNDQRTADVRGSADEEFLADESPELEGQHDPSPSSAAVAPEPAPVAPAPNETPADEPDPVPSSDATPAASSVAEAAAAAAATAAADIPALSWPTWGLGPARTRVVPSDIQLRPPYTRVWSMDAGSLIEFPPVIAGARLYFGTNLGRFLAVDSASGEIAWETDFGRCIASSPAVGNGLIYVGLMDPSPCKQHDQQAPGFLVALDLETGEEVWRLRAGVIESSPLVVDGVIYLGTWDRNVYAIDATTGEVRWTYLTGDQVKGAAAYRNGVVYIGSYDGKLYALDAKSGTEVWQAGGQAGFAGNGRFYSTPALAYGRVFIGNLDGKVYAFGAKSGDLIWSQSTNGFVYSSPAIFEETVYIGSFGGTFYALDAATGERKWSFDGGGPILGSATVLDGLVYFSTTKARTYALDARNGREVWLFKAGEYSPLVTDGERAYVVGNKRLFAFAPDDDGDGGRDGVARSRSRGAEG